jgi:hypothetical protein
MAEYSDAIHAPQSLKIWHFVFVRRRWHLVSDGSCPADSEAAEPVFAAPDTKNRITKSG